MICELLDRRVYLEYTFLSTKPPIQSIFTFRFDITPRAQIKFKKLVT